MTKSQLINGLPPVHPGEFSRETLEEMALTQSAFAGAIGVSPMRLAPAQRRSNLKGYIESQGGIVLAAVALTGKPYSAKLRLSPERLAELRSNTWART